MRSVESTAEVVSPDQTAESSVQIVSRPNAATVTVSAAVTCTFGRTSAATAAAHRRADALQPHAGGK